MAAPSSVEQFQRHLHVLQGGERLEQVVGLEDEAQLAPQGDQLAGRGAVQLAPQHLQAALLHGAERADERQQRGFARAGRAGHDDDFAAGHVEIVVEEHLLLQLALAEVMLQACRPARRSGRPDCRPKRVPSPRAGTFGCAAG